jgi:hypothetical protein
MGRARLGVVTFSYDQAIFYQYCAYQRIRMSVAAASFCKLEGSLNKSFI